MWISFRCFLMNLRKFKKIWETNFEKQQFEKIKKNTWRLFYTCVSKILVKSDSNWQFWVIFCPVTPLKPQKIRILKKWKKNAGDIILHICTKNHNHMMYDGIFSFWVIFCPFTSLKNPKIKILKKWKKPPGDIIIFHVYQKSWSYGVCFLRYRVPQTKDFAVLGHFLPLYPPNNSDNKNFEKMKKKKRLEILPFYTHKCNINKDQTIRQTDGRTD